MRVTQGTFSFLPDLTDQQIARQIDYCLRQGWALGVEHTDDPHPYSTYWEMWGTPLFGAEDASAVLQAVNACRKTHPDRYIKISAFNNARGIESVALSFIVNRPEKEPGFRLERQETQGRVIRYTLKSVAPGET